MPREVWPSREDAAQALGDRKGGPLLAMLSARHDRGFVRDVSTTMVSAHVPTRGGRSVQSPRGPVIGRLKAPNRPRRLRPERGDADLPIPPAAAPSSTAIDTVKATSVG
jgi:hypothetical protein